MEPSAFTNHVAQRFKQALPGYEIAIKGPLTLIVKGVSGQEMMQANLDTVYSFCQRNAPRCEDAIERQSSAIIDTVKHSGTAPQRSQLRAVLRPSAYIEQLRKQGGAPVAVPFMGDLWVASVVDFPTQVRFLNTKDLSSLSLSSAEAIDLAKRNVVAALPPLASVTRDLPARGIGTINGDAYEASRLLFVDMWAPLAKRFGGKLIVSAPATDFVLYSSENDPITIDALGALARKIATRAQRPVSFAVLQWSPTGWMQVSP
ncbi:MAG TPA: hypothetical protein VJR58_25910 [Vineibacter sp.]|nr:hypothetical protein [Vineibacter sp.]